MKSNSKTSNARGLQGKGGMERYAQNSRDRYRRSDTKITTKEGQVLKFLRTSRRLSMRKAGRLIGLSDTFVSHCEHGRIDLNPGIIAKFLRAYGCDYGHFLKLVQGNIEIPVSIIDECIGLLKRMDEDKLKTVRTILQSF